MADAPAIDPEGYRFRSGDRLADFRTDDSGPFADEGDARDFVEAGARRLSRLQHVVHAHGDAGLLVVFQGMDASGKDEAIVQVMAAMDPQQCEATHFHSPTDREARHDYFWQAFRSFPARGQVAVFNRSYYERVIGDRVHPDRLGDQHLPEDVAAGAEDGALWRDRLRQISDVERYLPENGIAVRKVFLHISKEAQRQRLLERTERPEKRWDFSKSDVEDRELWDRYMEAYEDAFEATSTDAAPWFVVPADQKWYARAVVSQIVADALGGLHDDFPEPDEDQQALLKEARKRLTSNK